MDMPRTLVLGIGNTLLSDEGVGVHALTHLQHDPTLTDDIEFLDGGTLSFTLAGPIEDAAELIVIDAAEMHADPGTVRSYVGDEMDTFVGSHRKRSVHEVGLLDLMAIATLTGCLPAKRALVGIQPLSTDWGEHPTDIVAQAIPRACAMVRDLLKVWRQ